MKVKYYRSYHFDDKDPIIEKVLAVMKQKKMTPAMASEESGVAPSTVYNWAKDTDEGGTRRPQFATLNATILACGYELRIMPAKSHNTAGNGNTPQVPKTRKVATTRRRVFSK